MNDLGFLDEFIDKKRGVTTPTTFEQTLYLFYKNGISYEEFVKLPVPYILSMIKCTNYEQEQEQKAQEEASKKRGKK